jgi:hypothetical protein
MSDDDVSRARGRTGRRAHRGTRVQRRRHEEDPEPEISPAQDDEPVGAQDDEQRDNGDHVPPRRRVGVARIATTARAQLQELIGLPVTAVLGVERRDDGDWELQLETVELQRVPETTSLMGLYEVVVAEDGEILEFRRTRRYHRGQADRGQGA